MYLQLQREIGRKREREIESTEEKVTPSQTFEEIFNTERKKTKTETGAY